MFGKDEIPPSTNRTVTIKVQDPLKIPLQDGLEPFVIGLEGHFPDEFL